MYRPKDWKNPNTPMQRENFASLSDAYFRQIADGKHIAYEAGADAMLEGLRDKTIFTFNDDSKVYWPQYGKLEGLGRGRLVFIPDEEK